MECCTGKAKTRASITSIINNIVSLAREILLIVSADPEIAKSLQMAQSQLNAMLFSAKDNRSWLSENEQIGAHVLDFVAVVGRTQVQFDQ